MVLFFQIIAPFFEWLENKCKFAAVKFVPSGSLFMISRRQLRIKVLQTLYGYYKAGSGDLNRSEKELRFNIQKAYDLYHYLMVLVIDVVLYAESRIDLARNKRVPTREDLHPNTRFVENKVVHQLRNNRQFLRYLDVKKLSWNQYPELIKELYQKLISSEVYKNYMEAEESTYTEDKKLITWLYTEVIYLNESLEAVLEEQSIYWNDDVEFIISMIIKTLRRLKENDGEEAPLLELYKNEEDKDFAIRLFHQSILHREKYLGYIRNNTRNWDLERIAFMDILIMQMAIAEMLGFPSIPTKVTLNEYLEIAKYYSTQKSNVFINGVLDKIVSELKEKNLLVKKGRGLIGEHDDPE